METHYIKYIRRQFQNVEVKFELRCDNPDKYYTLTFLNHDYEAKLPVYENLIILENMITYDVLFRVAGSGDEYKRVDAKAFLLDCGG